MSNPRVHLDGLTIAVDNLEGMAHFYSRVLDAELYPRAFGPAQLYGGQMAGLDLQLCPKEVAGIHATQNLHQLRFVVPNLEEALVVAVAAGGTREGAVVQAGGQRRGAVRDPDGNSIELVQVDKAP